MEIFVMLITGDRLRFEVSPSDSVRGLKSKIAQKEGLPRCQQNLVYLDTELDDNKMLRDYDILAGATLLLVPCARSGPLSLAMRKHVNVLKGGNLEKLTKILQSAGVDRVNVTEKDLVKILNGDAASFASYSATNPDELRFTRTNAGMCAVSSAHCVAGTSTASCGTKKCESESEHWDSDLDLTFNEVRQYSAQQRANDNIRTMRKMQELQANIARLNLEKSYKTKPTGKSFVPSQQCASVAWEHDVRESTIDASAVISSAFNANGSAIFSGSGRQRKVSGGNQRCSAKPVKTLLKNSATHPDVEDTSAKESSAGETEWDDFGISSHSQNGLQGLFATVPANSVCATDNTAVVNGVSADHHLLLEKAPQSDVDGDMLYTAAEESCGDNDYFTDLPCCCGDKLHSSCAATATCCSSESTYQKQEQQCCRCGAAILVPMMIQSNAAVDSNRFDVSLEEMLPSSSTAIAGEKLAAHSYWSVSEMKAAAVNSDWSLSEVSSGLIMCELSETRMRNKVRKKHVQRLPPSRRPNQVPMQLLPVSSIVAATATTTPSAANVETWHNAAEPHQLNMSMSHHVQQNPHHFQHHQHHSSHQESLETEEDDEDFESPFCDELRSISVISTTEDDSTTDISAGGAFAGTMEQQHGGKQPFAECSQYPCALEPQTRDGPIVLDGPSKVYVCSQCVSAATSASECAPFAGCALASAQRLRHRAQTRAVRPSPAQNKPSCHVRPRSRPRLLKAASTGGESSSDEPEAMKRENSGFFNPLGNDFEFGLRSKNAPLRFRSGQALASVGSNSKRGTPSFTIGKGVRKSFSERGRNCSSLFPLPPVTPTGSQSGFSSDSGFPVYSCTANNSNNGTSSGILNAAATTNSTVVAAVVRQHRAPQSSQSQQRCNACGFKLTISNTFQCRCGKTLCSKHKSAETHSCSYDYKGEGRKTLQKDNPKVVNEKFPKI